MADEICNIKDFRIEFEDITEQFFEVSSLLQSDNQPNTLCSKDYQLKDTLCDIEVNDARTDVKCNMNKTFLINQQPQFKLANE